MLGGALEGELDAHLGYARHDPADRDALLRRLADTDALPDLAERIAALPAGHRYSSRPDVLVALDINSLESRG